MSRRLFVALLILALCIPFVGPAAAVRAGTTLVYDFIANAAAASWRSSAVPLSFGGPNTDSRGFAMYVAPATMEDGTAQSRVLETHPQWVNDGWIEGTFNNITVPSGATLNLKVGFRKGATASNGVRYSVLFQENGTSGWTWFPNGTTTYNEGHTKTYDGAMWTYSWDLQDLAGKKGKFVLQVYADGSSTQDWACWQRADITALSVPTGVEAHGVGSDVTVSWDYSWAGSLLTSLKFEVQEFKLSGMIVTWVDVGTVTYPTKSLTLEGLTQGQHKFRVRAVESFTLFRPFPLGPITTTTPSEYSGSVSAWVLSAPVGAAVHHVENSRNIQVTWTSFDPLANGYEVLRTTNPLMRPSVVHEGPRTDTSWIDTGLDPNKAYYYYVRAWKTGTESSDRDVSSMLPMLTITTVPDAPTSQVARSSGRTITVSWVHSGNCTQFHVWSKPVSVVLPVMPDMLPATQRSKTIVDAEYGRWNIWIRAHGDGGYSPETPALDVWVLTTPSAPMATVGGSTTVNLSWGAPDANATSIRVLRSVSAGPFASLATVASSVVSYTDTTCLPGTTYAYELQAVRDDDVSDLSSASSPVTTPAALTAPAAPTGLTAVAQSPTAVGLTWTDNATNETAYKVYRRDGTHIVFGQVSPDLPAGTTSWQDATVAPASLYTYILKAVNAAGDSGWSNEAAVTTPAVPVPVPATPTNLVATAASPTVVNLIWTDNAVNEDSYRAYRKQGSGAFVQVSPDLPAGTMTWQDTTVASSSQYTYAVKARNPSGDSGWSNEASVTTPSVVQSVVMKLTIDKKNYTINGIAMTMDVAPVILESRTLGPVRYVAEALGAEVAWDPVERKVTLTRGSTTIELWIGRNTARVNGAYVLIDPENPEVKPVILPPGRTMLPFRFIAEQLGASVGWDSVKREVTITYPAP